MARIKRSEHKAYKNASREKSYKPKDAKTVIEAYVDIAIEGLTDEEKREDLPLLAVDLHACVDAIQEDVGVAFRVDGEAVKDTLKKYTERLFRALPAPEEVIITT